MKGVFARKTCGRTSQIAYLSAQRVRVLRRQKEKANVKGVCVCAKDMLQDFIDCLSQCAARQGTATTEGTGQREGCMHLRERHVAGLHRSPIAVRSASGYCKSRKPGVHAY